jgi:hypothetical protein
VGQENVAALAAVLSDMRMDRARPVVRQIGGSTMMMWSDEPEDWRAFRQLLDGMIKALQRESR